MVVKRTDSLKKYVTLLIFYLLIAGCGSPSQAPINSPDTSQVEPTQQTIPSPTSANIFDSPLPVPILTNFTHFRFRQAYYDFFCAETGLYDMRITRRPDGEYLFAGSLLEPGTAGEDACLVDVLDDCMVVVELPPRTLSPAEKTTVDNQFAEIAIRDYDTSDCPMEEAPCRYPLYSWDDQKAEVGPCDPPSITGGEHDMLEEFLTGLAETSLTLAEAAPVIEQICTPITGFESAIGEIALAPNGQIWVASSRSVARYDPTTDSWQIFSGENAPSGNGARTVTITESGNVWTTSWGEVGLSYYDGQQWQIYTTAEGLPSNEITEVAIDPDGGVWAATKAGVTRRDPTSGEWVVFDGDLSRSDIFRIEISPDGTLWFSSHHQVVRGTYNLASGNIETEIIWQGDAPHFGRLSFDHLTVAPDGRIWVQANGRPVYFDPQSGEWGDDTGCEFTIQSMVFTPEGQLWAGTDFGGVFACTDSAGQMPTSQLMFMDEDDGLSSNNLGLGGLVLDQDGHLWVGTTRGLSRCELSP